MSVAYYGSLGFLSFSGNFKLSFQRPLTLDLKSVFSAQGLWFRGYFDYLNSCDDTSQTSY